MQRVGYVACGVLVLGLWLPWATLSIGLLGAPPVEIGTVNGQDIGSGVLDLPVGFITAGAGLAGALGLARPKRGLPIGAGVAAVLASGYSLLAMPGEETTTAAGRDVSNLVDGQVGVAWGAFIVTAAACVLLVAALRVRNNP